MSKATADRSAFQPALREILESLTVSTDTGAWTLALTTKYRSTQKLVSATITGSTDWGASNTLAAGWFVANASTATGGNLYGLYGKSQVTTGQVFNYNAGIMSVLDLGSSSTIGTACGIIVDHASTTTRSDSPEAFIMFKEGDATNKPTKYLFDIGGGSKTVAIGTTSTSPYMATTATGFSGWVQAGAVKIRLNGSTYGWVPFYTAQAST